MGKQVKDASTIGETTKWTGIEGGRGTSRIEVSLAIDGASPSKQVRALVMMANRPQGPLCSALGTAHACMPRESSPRVSRRPARPAHRQRRQSRGNEHANDLSNKPEYPFAFTRQSRSRSDIRTSNNLRLSKGFHIRTSKTLNIMSHKRFAGELCSRATGIYMPQS